MQKLNYPLKTYIKVVEKIAEENGLARVKITPNKGSAVRFELFETDEDVPCSIWVIHHSHDKKRIVWSKENYRKAATYLNCTLEEFLARFEK